MAFCFVECNFLVMPENKAIMDKDPISEIQFDWNVVKTNNKEFSSRRKNNRIKQAQFIMATQLYTRAFVLWTKRKGILQTK